ncbi:MAG: Trm112 family protein [Rhizobiales bacterium]|nr:Trm112 family protein [Hyphomicrobiales bacterium]
MTISKNPNGTVKISSILLNILVCPLTGGALTLSRNKKELISKTGRLAFPVRDGIPIMIASEARNLTPAELKKLK